MPDKQQIVLTDEALREIEARYKRATPGPWTADLRSWPIGDTGDYDPCADVCAIHGDVNKPRSIGAFHELTGAGDAQAANCEFTAHAREDVPALCQTVRALRAENEKLKASRRVHELDNHHNALACGYCSAPLKNELTRLASIEPETINRAYTARVDPLAAPKCVKCDHLRDDARKRGADAYGSFCIPGCGCVCEFPSAPAAPDESDRALAQEVVGTVFDNTAASHGTLKIAMTERVATALATVRKEAALAQREADAQIAETHSATDCSGPDCGIVIAATIRSASKQER